MPRSSSPDGGGALGKPGVRPALPAAFGRYKVVRLIGEGAMGRVLLAHDPVLDRAVALKHLRDDLRIPRETREGLTVRMRHEARAAARVQHPNLVTLHDMGEDPEFGLYLVFEYVEGPTLKQRLLDSPLPPAQAARLARQLGEALTLAHRAGIVHRDIKPENIILSSTGGKVADFGIARIPDSTLTHQGGLMGTPAYSAPETFRAGKFSPESDQFSLAAVMYEAISGKRAFPGDDAVSVATKIAHEEPLPLAKALGLAAALDEVLARSLSKRPEDRYPSCEVFGVALAAALEGDAAASALRLSGEPAASSAHAAEPNLRRAARVESDVPPRERKTGQVVLGAAVVVATATLLARTALRSAELPPEDTAQAAGSSAPALTPPPRPRAAPIARPPRPKPEPVEHADSATTEPSASPPSGASAGAPRPEDASASGEPTGSPARVDPGPDAGRSDASPSRSADAGAR